MKRKVKMPGKDADTEVFVKTKPGKPEVTIVDDFAKDLNYAGFWVMAACDDDEVSYEWSWFQQGIFTFFVNLAFSGQADDSWLPGGTGNDDEVIMYDEELDAILALDDMFYDMFPSWQTPQFYIGVGDIDLFVMP